MEIFFIGLVLWIFGSMIFAELLPAVIELSVYLVRYIWMCFWEALKLAFWLLGWVNTTGAKGAAWALSHGALFFAILFEEWRNGAQAEDADEEFFEEEEEENSQSAYEQALALFCLTEPFTQEALKQIYRTAMKSAHTDIGGSKEEAQALNAARDLIMKTKSWK